MRMVAIVVAREPSSNRDERLSIHGVDPEAVLRALLQVDMDDDPVDDDESDSGDDTHGPLRRGDASPTMTADGSDRGRRPGEGPRGIGLPLPGRRERRRRRSGARLCSPASLVGGRPGGDQHHRTKPAGPFGATGSRAAIDNTTIAGCAQRTNIC
jgi:hypothetical protein